MRQVGILTAAARFALRENRPRLEDDHRRAKRLADALSKVEGLHCAARKVDTNIVVARVDQSTPSAWLDRLEQEGVRAVGFGSDSIRFVTHLDVTDADLDLVLQALQRVAASDRR